MASHMKKGLGHRLGWGERKKTWWAAALVASSLAVPDGGTRAQTPMAEPSAGATAPAASAVPASPSASAVPAAASAALPVQPAVVSSTTPPISLREAAQQAVLQNPEVLARWHAVRQAEAERDAARGALLPKIDLSAAVGPERRSTVNNQYSRSYGTLSLSQLLYDGFGTINEVRRLDHTTRTRLFELIEASENAALEATRAYVDVTRFRELVRLAEDNYVEHRAVFAQTDQRVKAKIARAVDLEQITGRLALAEANLLIETSNLHDTTARFQRIVGRMPPRTTALPPHLTLDLPPNAFTALSRAQAANAAILGAIETVRSAQALADARQAAYHPRLDFRLKRDQGRNLEGIPGRSDVTTAEVLLNWNLFNGFADRSRERQAHEQLNVAKDIRDKTCRDIRQVILIAFNDVTKLREQLEYLQVHEAALTKALTAYRQQFHIGQRTLLDLLDTENELFQARRAVVNARHDLHIAYARTQAALGNLLRSLELTSLQTSTQDALREWATGTDGAQACPAEPVLLTAVDKDALVQRALAQAIRTPMVLTERQAAEAGIPIGPGGTPTFAPPTILGPGTVLPPPGVARPPLSAAPPARATPPAAAPAAPPPSPTPPTIPDEQGVRGAIERWRSAWTRRDVPAYFESYAPGFAPAAGTRAAWESRRTEIISRSADVAVEISDLRLAAVDANRVQASFTQAYRSASFRDTVRKTLELQREGGQWRIVRETVEPLSTAR